MRSHDTLLDSLKGRKTEHVINSGTDIAHATIRQQTLLLKREHPSTLLLWMESRAKPTLKAKQQRHSLKQIFHKSQQKLFEELNGFTVDLTTTEAERLRTVPSIQSVEQDRPLPLSPPVEVRPVSSPSSSSAPMAASAESSALEHEVRLEKVFVGDVIESSESDLGAQGGISTSALPVYSNGTASTGEVLPYGVKAVWAARISAAKAMSAAAPTLRDRFRCARHHR